MRKKSKKMNDNDLTNDMKTTEDMGNVESNDVQPSEAAIEEEVRELDDSLDSTESLEEESLEAQVARLQTEAEDNLDGWQRARAEFANYKKRTQREDEHARQRIAGEILTHFLGVQDDLERALSKAPEGDDVEEWVLGIELIHQKIQALLDAEDVEIIEGEGIRFDPNVHEAVSFEDSNDHEEGLIIEVTQQGYKLGDRVLRPAMVRVAK